MAGISHPRRTLKPTAKLIDGNNTAIPETAIHRQAVENRAQAEVSCTAEDASLGTRSTSPTHASSSEPRPPVASHGTDDTITARGEVTEMISSASEAEGSGDEFDDFESGTSTTEGSDAEADDTEAGRSVTTRKRKNQRARKKKTKCRKVVVDASDNTANIEGGIEMVNIDAQDTTRKEDKSRDVSQFFSAPYTSKEGKKKRDCKICSTKTRGHPIANEVSTLRRHMQAHHEGKYRTWCEANSFTSMLPKDSFKRRENAKASAQNQTRLDGLLRPLPPKEVVIPYTDEAFNEAAREWLIETNQPIQALQHPSFQKMIHIAARATNGVKIADLRNTRDGIIRAFKKQMTALRAKLNSNTVKGAVNLTCDAWQADSTDGYFAVTGHWIEEDVNNPDKWELQTALLGFVRMNCSHSGRHLGLALFRIADRLGIAHKIGYVTCDNATNNDTMMQFFADHVFTATGNLYDGESSRVRCLAHIINLATQAFLDNYSKSRHYDPALPDADLVATAAGGRRDVVGLVRSIAVKARSSAQRKQLFLNIQTDAGIKHPKCLLMDMPVCWSSTYTMLHRAEELCEHVDTFVSEMAHAEKDKRKRRKLDDLQLTSEEWERVKQCLDLLAHADNAQQAFSSDHGPSLHLALPALEALQRAWSTRSGKAKYAEFRPALEAGSRKITEYYEKTAETQVYTFALLLNPENKTQFIAKSWGKDLLAELLTQAEETYKERYLEMYPDRTAPHTSGKQWAGASRKLSTLLREVSDDESSDGEDAAAPHADADVDKPWRADFHGYLKSRDSLGQLSIVQWWGKNAHRYPVWASLARDYLSVMAASVSSERAFSAAGITIAKRCSCLKADIVEALQCLKSLLFHELLFPELPSSLVEADIDAQGEPASGAPVVTPAGNTSPQVTSSWDAEILVEDNDADDAELPGAEDEEVLVPDLT
ncbi:Zinc finger BED domain-containing protein RICESLEEPER 2 [Trametes pubescens]|uniref:Zinc finger BED domain-containing protein RICESLEEPER 2 n=1 Tax=Trametes pubescens TaxID=154538 RepID=A0A1M2VKC9_TRAPU|nr:Zinc finger BED domain-containing protein RICESLEEPER 2 [Trametes pubescens]